MERHARRRTEGQPVMTEYHIPDEVVDKTATQMAFDNCQIFSNLPDVTKQVWRFRARAAITAALEAWVKTDSAFVGKGMNELQQFYPAIIIKTEAP
jgi:hypothetical protein